MFNIVIIVLLCGLFYYQNNKEKQTIKKLTREIDGLKNLTKTINTVNPFNGTFEIHISIDPRENFVGMLNYVNKHSKSKGMKIVFAASCVKNNQYMLSYFTRKEDDKLAVEGAQKIASELTALGMDVKRIKVEGHGVQNTPQTTRDYELATEMIRSKYIGQCGKPYFEFHAKIGENTSKEFCYEILENDIKKYENTAISHNLCSSTKNPLLTIRVYNAGFIDALKYKDHVMNSLKKEGYVFKDKVQHEFSIYDSFPELDNGWLINYK